MLHARKLSHTEALAHWAGFSPPYCFFQESLLWLPSLGSKDSYNTLCFLNDTKLGCQLFVHLTDEHLLPCWMVRPKPVRVLFLLGCHVSIWRKRCSINERINEQMKAEGQHWFTLDTTVYVLEGGKRWKDSELLRSFSN